MRGIATSAAVPRTQRGPRKTGPRPSAQVPPSTAPRVPGRPEPPRGQEGRVSRGTPAALGQRGPRGRAATSARSRRRTGRGAAPPPGRGAARGRVFPPRELLAARPALRREHPPHPRLCASASVRGGREDVIAVAARRRWRPAEPGSAVRPAPRSSLPSPPREAAAPLAGRMLSQPSAFPSVPFHAAGTCLDVGFFPSCAVTEIRAAGEEEAELFQGAAVICSVLIPGSGGEVFPECFTGRVDIKR